MRSLKNAICDVWKKVAIIKKSIAFVFNAAAHNDITFNDNETHASFTTAFVSRFSSRKISQRSCKKNSINISWSLEAFELIMLIFSVLSIDGEKAENPKWHFLVYHLIRRLSFATFKIYLQLPSSTSNKFSYMELEL